MRLIKENFPLIAILVGLSLISLPMGPFRSLDTQLELTTAQGVMKWGYPWYRDWGNLFNEPPLGFYFEAAFFYVFGFSEEIGTVLISAFGLAAVFIVYLLGKELYGKTTALVAAALFGLAPWQLILSRSFLIDVQCLLLSLIYLYVGVLAIRKSSLRLAAVSGVFFALALLTKFFAVFMLAPLLLFYFYQRPKNPRIIIAQFIAFTLPMVVSTLIWYQGILKLDLLYFFQHNDFKDLNFSNVTPTPAFATNFLINYGLGLAFFVATAVSLAFGFVFWRRLRRFVVADLFCLVAIVFTVGLVSYLAVVVNLKAPYTLAIKYIYQSLPFFSLIAASLMAKSVLMLRSVKESAKLKRALGVFVGLFGLVLLAAALFASISTARQLATTSYMVFQVEPKLDLGYSFYVQPVMAQNSPLLLVQLLGFAVVLSGLLWAARSHQERTLAPQKIVSDYLE